MEMQVNRQLLLGLYDKFVQLGNFNRDQVQAMRNVPGGEEIRLVCQGAELAYNHAARLIFDAMESHDMIVYQELSLLSDQLCWLAEYHRNEVINLRDLLGGQSLSYVCRGSELGYSSAARQLASILQRETIAA
ncbi:hypothetical protein ACOALA_20760 (plasmid) [Alicyclobacillus acidoterrestris]|uniref:hypothetical protein n=1 Tax=Alicyclobacillus acidoterrestris TaxID=1450 RepID=UPI003F538658